MMVMMIGNEKHLTDMHGISLMSMILMMHDICEVLGKVSSLFSDLCCLIVSSLSLETLVISYASQTYSTTFRSADIGLLIGIAVSYHRHHCSFSRLAPALVCLCPTGSYLN